MARLSIYLPPFSPDYSGVSSVFFDLPAVVALHDASGCTGNYTGYDEPRWYGAKAPIFCSGLRDIDAMMGDDEKLIRRVERACRDLSPRMTALIGSPVPMVVGSDMKGIAAEVESLTGLPSFGFDTTGTAYYDRGVEMALTALLERFAETGERREKAVNIVGATPLDFAGGGNVRDLESELRSRGFEVLSTLAMGYGLEAIRRAPEARVNLAVSRSGYLVAKWMSRRFGTPFLCGLPMGTKGGEDYFSALEEMLRAGDSGSLVLKGAPPSGRSVLIVGEQVQANALRAALERDFGVRDVRVGCLFGLEAGLALEGDLSLMSEAEVREAIRETKSTVIGDPFLEPLMRGSAARLVPFPLYAVSSRASPVPEPRYIGSRLNETFCGLF